MSTEPTPEAIERFVNRIRAERVAAGREPYIVSPGVYRLLDGLLLAKRATGSHTGSDTGSDTAKN